MTDTEEEYIDKKLEKGTDLDAALRDAGDASQRYEIGKLILEVISDTKKSCKRKIAQQLELCLREDSIDMISISYDQFMEAIQVRFDKAEVTDD